MPTFTDKPRFVSFPELRPRYGETRSRHQLLADIKNALYPAPKQLSAQRIGWETATLDRHYDNLPTVSYAPAPKEPKPAAKANTSKRERVA